MSSHQNLRIVTRNSPLALAQTNEVVKEILKVKPETKIKVIPVVSRGDQDLKLTKIINPGIFVKALEKYLLQGKADIAIHSLKDMPIELQPPLKIWAVLKRDNYRDVLVFKKNKKNLYLEKKGVIGTNSVRRFFFLQKKFNSFTFKNIRGNVGTRIEKLLKDEYDFLVLSKIGLKRLKINSPHLTIKEIPLSWLLPAPAQGTIAIEGMKKKFPQWSNLFRKINDLTTEKCVNLEREIMKNLELGCNSPIGCLVLKANNFPNHFWIRLNWIKNHQKLSKNNSIVAVDKIFSSLKITLFINSLKKKIEKNKRKSSNSYIKQ